jgi:hypothetical protein
MNSEEGADGVFSPYVDGTFSDDVTGVPAEHDNAPHNIGMSPLQLLELQNATAAYVQLAIDVLAAKGKYVWQALQGAADDGLAAGPSQSTCAAFMETVCAPTFQNVPMTMQWSTGSTQLLAAFLIGRGPVAYIGYGWNGGPLPDWDPLFDTDVGEPLALCEQAQPGVFSRKWSKGVATLDCNTWTGTFA